MKLKQIIIVALSMLTAGVASAASVAVANSSFETATGGGGGAGTGAWQSDPTNWVELGPTDSYIEGNGIAAASTHLDGDFWGAVEGVNGADFAGGVVGDVITQDLGVAILSNTTYTIDFAQARRGDGTNAGQHTSGIMSIGLFTGAADITAVIAGSANFDSADIAPNSSLARTFSFTTGAVVPGGNVSVFVRGSDGNVSGVKLYFDDIKIDASPVPEPSSTALLGLGGFALLLRRRK